MIRIVTRFSALSSCFSYIAISCLEACGKMVCIASRVDGKASYSDILKYCDKESSFININHNDMDKTICNIYPSDGVSLAVKKNQCIRSYNGTVCVHIY